MSHRDACALACGFFPGVVSWSGFVGVGECGLGSWCIDRHAILSILPWKTRPLTARKKKTKESTRSHPVCRWGGWRLDRVAAVGVADSAEGVALEELSLRAGPARGELRGTLLCAKQVRGPTVSFPPFPIISSDRLLEGALLGSESLQSAGVFATVRARRPLTITMGAPSRPAGGDAAAGRLPPGPAGPAALGAAARAAGGWVCGWVSRGPFR